MGFIEQMQKAKAYDNMVNEKQNLLAGKAAQMNELEARQRMADDDAYKSALVNQARKEGMAAALANIGQFNRPDQAKQVATTQDYNMDVYKDKEPVGLASSLGKGFVA